MHQQNLPRIFPYASSLLVTGRNTVHQGMLSCSRIVHYELETGLPQLIQENKQEA